MKAQKMSIPKKPVIALFDIDGTLVSVSALHDKAYRQAFLSVANIRVKDFNEIELKFGTTEGGFMKAVLNHYKKKSSPAIIQRLIDAYTQNVVRFGREITPKNVLPGVVNFLHYLKRKGVTLVAISGNPKKIGDLLLKRTKLNSFFTVTAFSSETFLGRSIQNRTEVLQLALLRLGWRPG
ncbi:MAG: HAD hydrolase-like protein, partial [archaeon]